MTGRLEGKSALVFGAARGIGEAIAQRFADEMNFYCGDFLNPYINFHRPCYFATEETDAKGKIRLKGGTGLRVTLPVPKLPSGPFDLQLITFGIEPEGGSFDILRCELSAWRIICGARSPAAAYACTVCGSCLMILPVIGSMSRP